MTGTGSKLISDGPITVGESGTGTLTIGDDGLVSVGAGAGTLHIAANPGSIGHLIIGDSGVTAGVLDAAAVEFGVGVGLLSFKHTDTDYTFAAPLSGAGTSFISRASRSSPATAPALLAAQISAAASFTSTTCLAEASM